VVIMAKSDPKAKNTARLNPARALHA